MEKLTSEERGLPQDSKPFHYLRGTRWEWDDMGITKGPSVNLFVRDISDFSKIAVKSIGSLSYLTGGPAPKREHLSNLKWYLGRVFSLYSS